MSWFRLKKDSTEVVELKLKHHAMKVVRLRSRGEPFTEAEVAEQLR
jgi:hypothetical protein